jgi:mono/diheme cytochrome c family protein
LPFLCSPHASIAAVLHLSEIHGAATHLAVVAIPLYAVVLLVLRRREVPWLAAAEPWVAGATIVGVVLAGITGLLVRGEAQTTLRGGDLRIGTIHFWLGIVLTVLVTVVASWRWMRAPRAPSIALIGGAVLALVGVLGQGYLGGRMTYQQAVGVFDGGQLAQSASGAAQLQAALARGVAPATAGKVAFSSEGLGCARCHGAQAQGARGPALAIGVDLADFRRVHGHGLFPPQIVSDADFRAIDAFLRTLR